VVVDECFCPLHWANHVNSSPSTWEIVIDTYSLSPPGQRQKTMSIPSSCIVLAGWLMRIINVVRTRTLRFIAFGDSIPAHRYELQLPLGLRETGN
jgi:hypothetical protein